MNLSIICYATNLVINVLISLPLTALKAVFKSFIEISPKEIIIQAAARQKYIDQSQSLNLMIQFRSLIFCLIFHLPLVNNPVLFEPFD